MKKGSLIIGGYVLGFALLCFVALSASWMHHNSAGEKVSEDLTEVYLDRDELPSDITYSSNRVYYYRVKEERTVTAGSFPWVNVEVKRDTLKNPEGDYGIYSQRK